jgi:GNAT superfamily N-acetyltransferase
VTSAPAGLLVEPWRSDDRDAILALHREAGWRAEQVLGEVLVARLGGAVAGAVHLLRYPPDEVLVGAIVVCERLRGRGIGAALMRGAMTGRPGRWWLECRQERIAFYERLGYAVVAGDAVAPAVRDAIGEHRSRAQTFMTRAVSAGYAGSE